MKDMHGWFHMMICGREFNLGSPCTQRTLIDIINIFFLVAYILGLLSTSFRKNYANGNRNRRWYSIIVSLCCALISIAYIILGIWDLSNGKQNISNLVVYFVRGIVWIALTISMHIHPTKLVKLIAFIWWVSLALLISAYNLEVLLNVRRTEILELMSWPVNILLLFNALSCIFRSSDPSCDSLSQPLLTNNDVNSAKLYKAGLFSRLTFSWLSPLLKLGYSKPLDLDDIPTLDSEDGAFDASQKFLQVWTIQKQEKSRSRNSIFLVLGKCYSKDILLTGFYALVKTISIAAAPILLYFFVWYSHKEERDLYMGFLLIVCLIVMKLAESLSQRHWFFESRRVGMRMRSALMAAVFQKQLKLSSQGRRNHSTGEVVNYIAVDAYRLGDFPYWVHMAWSQPLQLILSIVILFWIVGLGALPGLVPLIICGFLNVPFAKILQGYQSKFMVAQDERLRATSEVLNNMKIIKLQSWEEKYRQMIELLREGEFKWLAETQLKKAYGTALYWMSPTFVSAVILAGTAALKSAPLNASTIFTVLATLRVMSEPVRMLPEVLLMMIQVKVSLDRIKIFLLEDEIKEEDVNRKPLQNTDLCVRVQNGNFSWDQNGPTLTLRDINLSIPRGQKIAVCGSVGAGKSSLLSALLGEIPKISGSVEVFGSIAYVSQTSWIQSGTVRDNILFGKPFNKALYERAIKSCALDKDIGNFDHGDLTEIGQRGLNMSGGQKQRIQLARAVYNDADIYLLDDPFSAVDAHTAATLFYDCVMAALGNKTVILVTHQVEFLAETDKILVMENGQITQAGTYDKLLKAGTAFEQLVNAHKSSITILKSIDHQTQTGKQRTTRDLESVGSNSLRQNSDAEILFKAISAVQLTENEEKEIGDLGWKPYKDYLYVSKGSFFLTLVIFAQSSFVILQCLSTYWLAIGLQMSNISSAILVGVYAALSIISCSFTYFRSYFAAHLGLRASRAFFTGLMDSVFKAPMLFFDSTPVGRILTRASSDMSILDFDIPYSISFVIAGGVEAAMVIIVMATVTWQVLIVATPVTILMIYIQRYYIASVRELVRINGTTKAPVMNYAAESMLGVVTIRAFAVAERFIQTNLNLIDADATLFFHTIAALEWVLLRVEALQTLPIITSALFLVLLPQGIISPGFAGLCLSYALTLTPSQVFLTRFYSSLENHIISVERIKQFMYIPPEPPAIIPENRPPPSWPFEGRIDLQELMVKYRPNAPLVLKGITCTFLAGNKIGVVGRTGSGKTTLISALFRLIDPVSGRILIDGLDICSIGLKDLRTKLSIIPQEPTLFRGTVRSNLDPLGLHTDHEIWEVLEKCQLKSTISSLPTLLDSSVSDGGENWSAGQRQLFCLGRVLLRKNKILVLDEATASIDSATDAVLQRVIKQEFSSCTVITIAHRVPTVTDSDMVMVLSYGKLVEYEKPSKLMETKNSAFSKLVAEYWSNCRRNSANDLTIQ
ncbi:ABC transporter C family member 8-like isoform X3 [Ananas comosus]|uniref:ABC transporter C family member 8-like isoform X3 n=1 Tax=Ananas comosus TaxID=4615 RepID=A0A6P5F656_ANACO|nr:ABC transporter C family member 8-like isoform X3 [Ananas comosus]